MPQNIQSTIPVGTLMPVGTNANSFYFSYSPPLEAVMSTAGELEVLPSGPERWRESDYLDRAEMYKLMQDGKEWEYAFCQWLMNQEEHDGSFPEGWQHWYRYAVTHCVRFRKEQPYRHAR